MQCSPLAGGAGGHGWFTLHLAFTSLSSTGQYGLKWTQVHGARSQGSRGWVTVCLANGRALWSLVPFHDWQTPFSPGRPSLPPSTHRRAMDELTKEMPSGWGQQVGEKRLGSPSIWARPCWWRTGLQTTPLTWKESKKVEGGHTSAADILSFKHIFFFFLNRKLRGSLETSSWLHEPLLSENGLFEKFPWFIVFRRLRITLYYSCKISWVFHVKHFVLLKRKRELILVEPLLCAGQNGPSFYFGFVYYRVILWGGGMRISTLQVRVAQGRDLLIARIHTGSQHSLSVGLPDVMGPCIASLTLF